MPSIPHVLPAILPQKCIPVDDGAVYRRLMDALYGRSESIDFTTKGMLERVTRLRSETSSYESMNEARGLLHQLIALPSLSSMTLTGVDVAPVWEFESYRGSGSSATSGVGTMLSSATVTLKSELANVSYVLGFLCARDAYNASHKRRSVLYAKAGAHFDEAATVSTKQLGPMAKEYLSGLAEVMYGLGYESEAQKEAQSSANSIVYPLAKAALAYTSAEKKFRYFLNTVSNPKEYTFIVNNMHLHSVKSLYYSACAHYFLSQAQGALCEAQEAKSLLDRLKKDLESHIEYREAFDVVEVCRAVGSLLTHVDDQAEKCINPESTTLVSLEDLSVCMCCEGRRQVQSDATAREACASLFTAEDALLEINLLNDKLITYEHELKNQAIELEELRSGRTVADQQIFTTEISRLEVLVDEQGEELERLRNYIADKEVGMESVSMAPLAVNADMAAVLQEKDAELARLRRLLTETGSDAITATATPNGNASELQKLLKKKTDEALQHSRRANELNRELQELRILYAEMASQPRKGSHDTTLDATVYTSEIERLETQLTEQGDEIERLRDYIAENEITTCNYGAQPALQQWISFDKLLCSKDDEIRRLQRLVCSPVSQLTTEVNQIEKIVYSASTEELEHLRGELTRKTTELREAYALLAERSSLEAPVDQSVYNAEISRLEILVEEQGDEIERLREYIAEISQGTQQMQPVVVDLPATVDTVYAADTVLCIPTPEPQPFDTWTADHVESLVQYRAAPVPALYGYGSDADIPVVSRVCTPEELSSDTWMSSDVASAVPIPVADVSGFVFTEIPIVSRICTPEELSSDTWIIDSVPSAVHIHVADVSGYKFIEIPELDRIATPKEVSADTWMSDDVVSAAPVRMANISDFTFTEIPVVSRVSTPEEFSTDTWMSGDVPSAVPIRVADVSGYTFAEVPEVCRIATPEELSSNTWMSSDMPALVSVRKPTYSDKEHSLIQRVTEYRVDDATLEEMRRLEKEVESLREQIAKDRSALATKDVEIRQLLDDLETERANIKQVEVVKEVPVYLSLSTPGSSSTDKDVEKLKSKHRYEIANLNDQIDELKNQLNEALTAKPQVVTEYKFSDINYDKLLAEKDTENERMRAIISMQARSLTNAANSKNYGRKAKEATDLANMAQKSMAERIAAANEAAARALATAPESVQMEVMKKKLQDREKVIGGLIKAMNDQNDSFASLHRAHTQQEEKYANLCSVVNEQEETIRTLLSSPSVSNNFILSTTLREFGKASEGDNSLHH